MTQPCPASTSQPRIKARRGFSEAIAGYGLAAPAAAAIALLLFAPTIAVVAFSLTDWEFASPTVRFIGLANFAALAQDDDIRTSLVNSLWYVAIVVPGSLLLGMAIAVAIESEPTLKRFWRAVHFLPVMATMVAMAVAWEAILHPTIGLLNHLLSFAGIGARNWLSDPNLVLPVLCVIGIWENLGFAMVLFLAGLTAIPRDLYEAAELDGADSPWSRFQKVTWPMLGPVTMFVLITTAIRAFRVFDTIAVLTKGGPYKSSEMILYTIYTEGFGMMRAGYAAALTTIFLVIVLTLTLLQARVLDRRVHYK
jgi:multiple sugar transport system permease protein